MRSSRSLEGQTALVTGGGKGFGRAIALALAARGVRVVVTGREEKALGETVGEIAHGGGKARHLAGDVRDPAHLAAAVARAIEVFGGLDIVVANAGKPAHIELGGDLERAKTSFETNVMGAYYTFNAAVSRMQGPGRLFAVCRGAPDLGQLGLCRAVAAQVARNRITCNALVPGVAAVPEEVAELVVLLCGSGADGITGQAIAVDAAEK